MRTEEDVWKMIDPADIWVMDKLILSRKLGYICGPVGTDVPKPGWYIIRPCVNMKGLGLGAEKKWLDGNTDHLPHGYFWCEWFEGRHLSVDYEMGLPILTVEGFKGDNTLSQWDRWVRVQEEYHLPEFLIDLSIKYNLMNCEFIGDKLIEVHFRLNPDFANGANEVIPIFTRNVPDMELQGYTWVSSPELHGRIGFWMK